MGGRGKHKRPLYDFSQSQATKPNRVGRGVVVNQGVGPRFHHPHQTNYTPYPHNSAHGGQPNVAHRGGLHVSDQHHAPQPRTLPEQQYQQHPPQNQLYQPTHLPHPPPPHCTTHPTPPAPIPQPSIPEQARLDSTLLAHQSRITDTIFRDPRLYHPGGMHVELRTTITCRSEHYGQYEHFVGPDIWWRERGEVVSGAPGLYGLPVSLVPDARVAQVQQPAVPVREEGVLIADGGGLVRGAPREGGRGRSVSLEGSLLRSGSQESQAQRQPFQQHPSQQVQAQQPPSQQRPSQQAQSQQHPSAQEPGLFIPTAHGRCSPVPRSLASQRQSAHTVDTKNEQPQNPLHPVAFTQSKPIAAPDAAADGVGTDEDPMEIEDDDNTAVNSDEDGKDKALGEEESKDDERMEINGEEAAASKNGV